MYDPTWEYDYHEEQQIDEEHSQDEAQYMDFEMDEEDYITHWRKSYQGFIPSPMKYRGEWWDWTQELGRLISLLGAEGRDNQANIQRLQAEARRREKAERERDAQ